MEVREAILKAADHIERNPQEFDYGSCNTPAGPGCGTPGCAYGWILTFLGLGVHAPWANAAPGLADYQKFDGAMCLLCPDFSWICTAIACAATLRRYADCYHPATLDTQDRERVAATTTTTPKAFDFEALASLTPQASVLP